MKKKDEVEVEVSAIQREWLRGLCNQITTAHRGVLGMWMSEPDISKELEETYENVQSSMLYVRRQLERIMDMSIQTKTKEEAGVC